MHPLDDVSTIVEHSLDVLRVDGARKVWVTIVLAVAARRTYALDKQATTSQNTHVLRGLRAHYTYEKLISYKVLGPYDIRYFRGIRSHPGLDWCLVACEFRKVILQFVLARLDLFR